MITLANEWLKNPVVILVGLVIIFGIIVLAILLVKKFLFKEEKPEMDEKQIAKENVERYLEDVEDEETKKQFEQYENEQKENK
ncbi:MAG: hypothetical protein IJ656_01340 [Bacilli bacterium]|nr:hypothetical protein [Bacilli bacterium]